MKKPLFFVFSFLWANCSFAQVSTIKENRAILAAPAAPTINAFNCANTPTKVWDKTLGADYLDYLSTLLPTKDGGYLLGGSSKSGISGDKSQDNQGWSDCWVIKTDANGNKVWDKTFGGNDDDGIAKMIQTPDGGYILAASSLSGLSGDKSEGNKGDWDYWIIKIDGNGNKIWDKTIGGNSMDIIDVIVPAYDGGYLLAGVSYSGISGDKTEASLEDDGWVVKIDANGNKIWDKTFGGASRESINSIIADNNGYYLLGGTSDSGISGNKTQASKGGFDFWLIKIDANGNKIWDKCFGGNQDENFSDLVSDKNGNYVLAGWTTSGISGDKTQASKGEYDYWLIKTDTNGNKIWDKGFGGDKADFLVTLIPGHDGGYILAGNSSSDSTGDKTHSNWAAFDADFWLVKVDDNGNKVWDKTYGTTYYDTFRDIIQTADGGYLFGGGPNIGISGDKTEESKGETDFWITKMTDCIPVTNFCTGQTFTLIATNCTGTINWSTGSKGNSIQVSTGGTYTATCTLDNETSSISNSIIITPATASLSGTASSGTNKAINTLTSTQTIPSGTNTSYEAGKSISLQGTFHAQTGSVFKAEIKGCE